jgi:hypothetical protein
MLKQTRLVLCLGCLTALTTASTQAAGFDPMQAQTAQQFGRHPDDSARPGEKFFYDGVRAYGKDDYSFAIDRYRVSASWGYKPAEYNLGVMYTTGDGTAIDRPLGLAWLALAAERGDSDYVAARDRAYAAMSYEEYSRANEIWRELRKTYGDEVALRRAKNRWQQARSETTGSHLGAPVSPVAVGGRGHMGTNVGSAFAAPQADSYYAFGITGPGAVDGSIAFRQLRESDNPYDAKFKQQPVGTVTVEDVIPIGDGVQRHARETRFL